MSKLIRYFVEGECEQKLINTLKAPPANVLAPGKVEVFNVINQKITKPRLANIKSNTLIVFVYDTDVENIDILIENIKRINDAGFNDIIHILSIKTFEDEILYSSNLKNINDMFNTKDKPSFKRTFISQNDLYSKLKKIDFDSTKLWSRTLKSGVFAAFSKSEYRKMIDN